MSTLPDVIDALVELYTDKPGLTTVRASVPTVAPENDELPMLFLDVRGASTESTSHRRTMIWPIDIYLLTTNKSEDLAADLATVYPWPETLVGWLDEHIALGGLLAGSVRYPEPMMEDTGPILLLKRVYFGCILFPHFPVKIERTFSP